MYVKARPIRDNVRCSCCASDCLLNHREKIEIKCWLPINDRWWEKLVCCILSRARCGRCMLIDAPQQLTATRMVPELMAIFWFGPVNRKFVNQSIKLPLLRLYTLIYFITSSLVTGLHRKSRSVRNIM